MAGATAVGVEVGRSRAFASAFDWPGWSRGGRDEPRAIEALETYRERYRDVLRVGGLAARIPVTLHVEEHVEGNATTDFGAPDVPFADDERPVGRRELARSSPILEACWSAFDRAVAAASGVELRRGPRGGGRALEAIVDHVVGAEASYVRRLAWKPPPVEEGRAAAALSQVRDSVRVALEHAVVVGLPAAGPRGGVIWTPRRFLRRAAWHVLDHAWEIEDRAGQA